jgi:hypothetical protein
MKRILISTALFAVLILGAWASLRPTPPADSHVDSLPHWISMPSERDLFAH